jgi:phage terminase large subunit
MTHPKIELSKKQGRAWHLLERPDVLEVFAGGGAGGGKSWLGCVWQIMRRRDYPGTRGFIGRENFTALRDSTMNTYFSTLDMMGLKPGEAWNYNAQEHTVRFTNGSEQHFRHMSYMPSDPNYDRFGSTEYTDAFVDEAPEVQARACQVLLSRLRYKHTDKCSPALLYTGNPSESWVKTQFVMDANNNFINLPKHRRRVLFTVADNPDKAIREGYARTLEHLDPYDRARLLDGDWTAQQKADKPFAYAFEERKHVGKAERRPNDAVYFSVDFNVEPFTATASHIWQDAKGHHFHTFAEAALKDASVRSMAEWMRAICPLSQNIKITGDRGGMSRGIGTQGPMRLFDMLQKELRVSPNNFLVPANPTHLQSREDCNFVLTTHPDCIIDTTCTRLISDMRTVEIEQTGTSIKIKKADRSKASQQADALDCYRYAVNTYLRNWITQNRRR